MDASILILNEQFVATYPVSEFGSLVWTECYYKPGSFELRTIYTQEIFDNIKIGNYVYLDGSDTLMVVESVQIGFDPADRSSQVLVFKGRSIESMLDRRVIAGKWTISDQQPMQTEYFNLISANAVYPTDKDRKLDMFSLGLDFTDPVLTERKVSASGYFNNLYEVIQAGCQSEGFGFKAIYVDGASTCILKFYVGKDRSYDQNELPPVIFSANYENLRNVRYGLSTEEYKTFVYAYGPEEELEIRDDEGNVTETIKDRTLLTVAARKLTGANRREMSVSSSSSVPQEIQQEVMEKLAKTNQLDVMDAELDARRQFVYGEDFFMGDVVQVITEFGLDTKARVTEFTRCWQSDGYQEVPVFEVMSDEQYTSELFKEE